MLAIATETLQPVTIDRPRPGAHEVLIEVAAAGINRPDLAQRQGHYPPPPGASPILGLEVAGRVAELGAEVTHWRVGDAVCALLSGGGYAEYCLADAGCCLPVPEHWSFIEAAALPENLFTVWSNVYQRAALQPGETLLVHGGASGIGTTAIQLARAFGNPIYVTAGGEEKCRRCLDLGADAAINYREQNFVEEIARLTAQRGVDVVLDMVGGDYLARNIKCLAEQGRLVQIAVQQGLKGELNLWALMSKRLTVTGSTLRPRDAAFKRAIAEDLLRRVLPLLQQRRIVPIIDSVFALQQVAQAHEHMAESRHFGKIVIDLQDSAAKPA
jgi:NADPH:quinone reductase